MTGASAGQHAGTGPGLKSLIRRTGCRLLGPVLRRVPLSSWPAWCGDLFEVKVPANVRRKAATSPEGGANINVILDLLARVSRVPGDIAECGVFRGSTLIPITLAMDGHNPPRHVFGLDSFAGFDRSITVDLALGGDEDPEKREGGFSGTSRDFVLSRIRDLGLQDRVDLVAGYFEATLPTLPERRYSFVHLDCDIYEGYRDCLEYFYPRLEPGGIILFDEYNDPPWPGCNKAIDEFLAGRPETVQPIARDGYEKFYIVKTGT